MYFPYKGDYNLFLFFWSGLCTKPFEIVLYIYTNEYMCKNVWAWVCTNKSMCVFKVHGAS